jgi:hypothetical protein
MREIRGLCQWSVVSGQLRVSCGSGKNLMTVGGKRYTLEIMDWEGVRVLP